MSEKCSKELEQKDQEVLVLFQRNEEGDAKGGISESTADSWGGGWGTPSLLFLT